MKIEKLDFLFISVIAIIEEKYSTAAILPQEHAGKNKALLAVPAHCQRQEHQGSREPSIRASPVASFFAVLHIKGYPSWNSAPKRTRTIRTLAESRDVLM